MPTILELLVFAGAASKPPTEEAAKAFEKKTGVKVNVTFGGSGFVLSQMTLAKKGDGSSGNLRYVVSSRTSGSPYALASA
ncbi:MAG TPA: substrate-binding domain-containing protein [Syntrophorhabdaceae bacterium]|jgi:molybdate transport system substrate-binding protein